jgi:hypothetical protein
LRAVGLFAAGGVVMLGWMAAVAGWWEPAATASWLAGHAGAIDALGVGLALLAAGAWSLTPRRRAVAPGEPGTDNGGPDLVAVRYTVLSIKTIWWTSALVVIVGIGMAVWLLLAFGHGDAQERNQLEAIKTAGTIVVGTGGAVALLLAARRQRSTEIALKQKDRDQAHQERVAAATEADALERRVTELYTKAADQLGSEKAPVRLAGLYALERLAQANPSQRQTVVNVLCAYLRMPYQPPEEAPRADAGEQDGTDNGVGPEPAASRGDTIESVQAAAGERERRIQEREVRLTAQRILTDHLLAGPGRLLFSGFWGNRDLDLTGALLIDFSLFHRQAGRAKFNDATFLGHTAFTGATFTESAYFDRATFTGYAGFDEATFTRYAGFDGATFTKGAKFAKTTFSGQAGFHKATFIGSAQFEETTFTKDAWFTGATFTESAESCLSGARFGTGRTHRLPAGWRLVPSADSEWSLAAPADSEWSVVRPVEADHPTDTAHIDRPPRPTSPTAEATG